MPQENPIAIFDRYYEKNKRFESYFIAQSRLIFELIKYIDGHGKPNRLDKLDLLLFSLATNGQAIVNLIKGGFIPESYLISRSFFEKCVNYCYLNVCDKEEYENQLSWSLQKRIRALYTKKKAYKNIDEEIPLPDISELLKYDYHLGKFTGKKGGEKPNWTKLSLYDRINYIKNEVDIFTHETYLLAMNVIYENASESIHGTIYGATFHTGILYGIKETSEESMQRLVVLGTELFCFLGFLINGLIEVTSTIIPADELLKKAKDNFNNELCV